jgi:uncharacterized protein YqjF (DUF2071 family)
MTNSPAAEHADHRPWPMPDRPWAMVQTWNDLLFAHWPIPIRLLRPLVPPTLNIDVFDGDTWLGIVPFGMSNVRLRGLPALPWVSSFPELNVRCYVSVDDKPGVYFFSLDAGNLLAVAIARRWYHLPYFRARMEIRAANGSTHYTSTRTHRGAPPGRCRVVYRPTDVAHHTIPGTLEHWLTARYCLYTYRSDGTLERGEIHHGPWPLQTAEAEFQVNTLTEPLGLDLPDVPPVLHFARRLDIYAWTLEPVRGVGR